MTTKKPIIRGRAITRDNEDTSFLSGNSKTLSEQQKIYIRQHLEKYNHNANKWKEKYGGANPERTEAQLLGLASEMNYQSSDKAIEGEEEMGAILADKVEDVYMSGDPNQYGNKLQRLGKGGVRGAALMWNTYIDAGREAVDFENWAILGDKLAPFFGRDDTVARDKFEKMAENVKRRAMKYGVGGSGVGNPLMELWGHAISSDYDYRNLLDRIPKDMKNDTSWFKVDLPWENQNLGAAGRFGEILAMEAMTMGPLAAMKLARASHVINYFKKAAGGEGVTYAKATKRAASQMSKAELDAVSAGSKYTPIKLVTKEKKKKTIFGREKIEVKGGLDVKTSLEILDKNNIRDLADKGTMIWNPITSRFWTKPKQTKEAYSKLLDLASAEGRWIGVVPFLGRKGFKGPKKMAGSYREAEIYASLAAAAGGATMYDLTQGSEWSILGEVAGGVMGARVINLGLQTSHDIFNSLRYNLRYLTPEQKADAVMRSFGYERAGKDMVLSELKDIGPEGAGINIKQGEYYDKKTFSVIDNTRKNRIVDMVTAMPGGGLFGSQNAKDRAFLKSLRSMHDMIDSLPQNERQNFYNRLMLQDKLFSKFANVADSGRLFSALGTALSMDVLNTVRKKALGTKTLGHRVKLKLDPSAIALAERELVQTDVLIDIMMHFGNEAWETAGLDNLIVGFKEAALQSLRRVEEDIGPGGIVATFKKTNEAKLKYITKMANKQSLGSETLGLRRFEEPDGTIKVRTQDELNAMGDKQGLKQGEEIDFDSNKALVDADKTVEEYMDAYGAHFMENKKTGELIYMNILDKFSDKEIKFIQSEAPKLINNAFRVARFRSRAAYNKIRNYKDTFSSKKGKTPEQQLADAKASHVIMDTLGQELMAIKAGAGEDLAKSGRLGAFSEKIEDFDNLESFLEAKRAQLLSNSLREGRINEEIIAKKYTEMAKTRNFARTSVQADPVKELDAIPVEQQIEEIANNLDVSLKDINNTGYDFSLETMTTMRSNLKEISWKNLQTDDIISHKNSRIQREGSEAISTALDNAQKVSDATSLQDWKNANQFYKTNVADIYYKGVGYNMIARNTKGDKKTGPLYLFDQFIGSDSPGMDWERNAQTFKRMFDIEGVKEGTRIADFSQKARDLLKRTIKWRGLNNKDIPEGFNVSFGGEDLLDYRKEVSKMGIDAESTTPLDKLGRIYSGGDYTATQKLRDKISPVTDEVQQIMNREEQIISRQRADTIIKDDFGLEGFYYRDVEAIFGRVDAAEKDVRQLIIDATYQGGNTRQSDKIYNILQKRLDEAIKVGDVDAIAKYERGIHGLERILWDGAMEQAQLGASKIEGIRIKKGVLPEKRPLGLGVKKGEPTDIIGHTATDTFGDISGSTFETVMKLDADGFNIYVSTNRNLLEKMLSKRKLADGTNMWDKINDMNSLITLIAGEVPTAAMEGLPKHFRVEQIISRIYSIARGVVSPRYVLTELLIQDWRFRRGELIKDLATDQDASKLLYDVIFTNGLKNPRVRSEFVSKWVNTFVRYNRGNEVGDHSNISDDSGESQHITQTKERAGAIAEGIGTAYNWGKGKLSGN